MSLRMLFAIVCFGAASMAVGELPARSDYRPPRQRPDNLAPAAISVGPEIQLSVGGSVNSFLPDVAYNSRHDEYLAVYHERWPAGTRDIAARRVFTSGQPELFGYGISPGSGQRIQPAVAYNYTDDQYLIVYMKDPTGTGASNSPYEIWGVIFPGQNPTNWSEFLIYKWANRAFWSPRVVWNSWRNEYFVIWNAMDTTTMLPNDVAGVRVSPSGVVDSLAHIITMASSPMQSDIAYNVATNEYFVVWRMMYTSVDWDIWGARVAWDGTVNATFPVNNTTLDQQSPAISTNQQDRYFVVWEQRVSAATSWDIVGLELDVSGNPVGILRSVWTCGGTDPSPAVVAKPGLTHEYYTVFGCPSAGGIGIRGKQFIIDTGFSEAFDIQSLPSWNYGKPTIGAGRSSYFVAYEGQGPSGSTNIYGRMWPRTTVYVPLAIH